MNSVKAATYALLPLCAALTAACDRSPPAPPPAGEAAHAPASLKASDPSCTLQLRNFGRSRIELVGNILGYPTNRVIVDRAGTLLWNARSVGLDVLEDYIENQAQRSPPPMLYVTPERDAPCASVQQVLAAAVRAGRCRPDRCVFEWPGTNAPPRPTE